jgi:DNA-binding transcriptional LysR family regulator
MDVNLLKLFICVAQEGSISKAAERLNYVQSNVSARIQQLEKSLDTQLIYRHPRGISLTATGKTLLQYAEKIVHLTNEAEKAIRDTTDPKGSIYIGAMEQTASIRLPPLLADFYSRYPGVDLNVTMGITEQLLQQVLDYELEGAFIDGVFKHPDIIEDYVWEEQLVLVFNSSYVIKELKDIEQQTFLLISPNCTYRARTEKWFEEINVQPKKYTVMGTLESTVECIKAGFGISVLPKYYVRNIDGQEKLAYWNLPEQYASIPTVFIRRKDLYVTHAMRQWLELLKPL